MFYQIERELLNGEAGFVEQQSQQLTHFQLLDTQEQGIRDIWELPQQESVRHQSVSKRKFLNFAIFSKLRTFSFKLFMKKTERRVL
ncbi:hypothetical protein ACQFX9_14030 [Aliinostoc sp. HNIBRCY26]|uniref:hypothetical protein n=1 Tax=Aliinostoc sp. HNIBRCY26 TaxID=3418997 RepID=UPI003CFD51B2